MDEIIRAVRDCPSGALSFALDGTEARDQVDHGNARPPGIEVTRNGPYRVTGGVPLLDDDGAPAVRAAGSSREHYALCRCGHSRNKPFCSGMHWFVDFRDPVPPPGHEPTPFERAGGWPSLTRAAGWLAEALGGPSVDRRDGDLLREVVGWTDGEFGEAERARWVALFASSADEAPLPGDPAVRARLSSAVEWLARTAVDSGRRADAVSLPAPEQPVGFDAHVRPLFREQDRQAMLFAVDLWSADDVRAHAADILRRLRNGSMPCDGAWPPERVDVVRRWVDTGMRP
jgi:CDGSH-type Zn-finger protein